LLGCRRDKEYGIVRPTETWYLTFDAMKGEVKQADYELDAGFLTERGERAAFPSSNSECTSILQRREPQLILRYLAVKPQGIRGD